MKNILLYKQVIIVIFVSLEDFNTFKGLITLKNGFIFDF